MHSRRRTGDDCCELTLEDATGRGVGVLWPSAKELRAEMNGAPVDLLVKVEPDKYSGSKLEVVDVRKPI